MKSPRTEILIHALIATAIAFVLFFIDEGYNDLRWMSKSGNWIAFGVYVLLLWAGQMLYSRIVLRRMNGLLKWTLSAALGMFTVLAVLYSVNAIIRL